MTEQSFFKRYWWAILGAISFATLSAATTITNADGYLNITASSNNTVYVINWNGTRIADVFNDGLMSSVAYTALQGKALAGNCPSGSFVQNASTSGVQCSNTTGVTKTCTSNIVVVNGLITSCT